jgi:hypothetical protein
MKKLYQLIVGIVALLLGLGLGAVAEASVALLH